jgi:aryl-alcohol dehydrogenase-like predicted oxidoreductase
MARLREAGIAIGLTSTGPEQARVLDRALDVRVDGVGLFATLQATWNVLERSAAPALQRAHAEGVGVIVKEALANGRLTERNRDPAFTAALARLRAHAARLDASLDQLALGAVLDQPWADVVPQRSGDRGSAAFQSRGAFCRTRRRSARRPRAAGGNT